MTTVAAGSQARTPGSNSSQQDAIIGNCSDAEWSPDARYLELLKKALSFSLWPEPPVPLDRYNYIRRPLVLRSFSLPPAASSGHSSCSWSGTKPISERERTDGMFWPGYADTMIGQKRLDNLQFCVESALSADVPGDLIETGVWRGGAGIFMRGILAAHGDRHRRVFVADSFCGLPKPDAQHYPADRDDEFYLHKPVLGVSRAEVENNFRRYDLLDDRVVFLEGWFKDTLPVAPIEKLSVMRLDGDLYESTMDALVNLYPKLSPGGFCVIDDYALQTCKKAVDDYRQQHHITAQLHEVDWSGRYWQKSSDE